MPRRFRRYARSARTVKPVRYSNETVAGQAAGLIGPATTQWVEVVSATTAQGVRKVKNPTMRFVTSPPLPSTPLLWALIYAPQGFDNFVLSMGAAGGVPTSIFEPNQNVIMSGLLNPMGTAEPVSYRSRLARNLESGDRLVLLFYNPHGEATTVTIGYSLNYAICYG
jgi:hypothetical protein